MLCVALLLAVAAPTPAIITGAVASTITVNSTNDDIDPADGECTLREAITAANTDTASGATAGECAVGSGADTIQFDVNGGATAIIQPTSALPFITAPVTLDASTQGCAAPNRCIELDGSLLAADGFDSGLIITSNNITVRGFAINRFPGDGIAVIGGSNNFFDELFIGTDVSGTVGRGNGRNSLASSAGILLTADSNDNRIVNSLLSGNNDSGVSVRDGDGNRIESSKLGTDRTGTIALPNEGYGVVVGLGGPTDLANNTVVTDSLVSGNGFNGIRIFQGSGLHVINSKIGTNQAGTAALPNGSGSLDSGGINLSESANATITGNLISGNNGDGIEDNISSAQIGSNGHTITGNTIGTNLAGTAGLPNTGRGIQFISGDNITVGTKTSGNLISGNHLEGIRILGDNTRLESNVVGLNRAESSAIANGSGLSNFSSAIILESGSNFVVQNNVIAGNAVPGLSVLRGSDHRIEGNRVGLNGAGTAEVPNTGDGIRITGADAPLVRNNVVSGNTGHGLFLKNTDSAQISGNTIGAAGMGNGGASIVVRGGTGNSILGNSISANAALGIDLNNDGVTANDAGDGDSGPNNLQNFPVLSSAVSDGTSTTITGTLNSTAGAVFRVEFFANDTCDESNHGEGQRFLNFAEVATDGSGDVTFTEPVEALAAPPGAFITATATDPDGNTSEFSACIAATGEPPVLRLLYLPLITR